MFCCDLGIEVEAVVKAEREERRESAAEVGIGTGISIRRDPDPNLPNINTGKMNHSITY